MTDIFVFGSNLMGIHGAGAARYANLHHGAVMGRGIGLEGTSYAIPTKAHPFRTLPLFDINKYVADFLICAKLSPEYTYLVTKIGCGLAGYTPSDIAPMFHLVKHLNNVKLPKEFFEYLPQIDFNPNMVATFPNF
jgi:hypothetical protein